MLPGILILILVIMVSLFGITYAFFDYYKLGVNQEIISVNPSTLDIIHIIIHNIFINVLY